MVAVGLEISGSWAPTSGVVGFFIALLLLSIFLTALCSECSRRSFELSESEANKDPSALIKVVKLEEALEERENPMIDENLKDETVCNVNTVSFTPWRSHLEAPQNHHDGQANGVSATHSETAEESNPEEESPAPFALWRSHLNQDLNSSSAPHNIYQTIGVGGSITDEDASSMMTNQGKEEEPRVRPAATGDSGDVNSMYAQVTPPVPSQEVQEEEVSVPPLPDRRTLEG